MSSFVTDNISESNKQELEKLEEDKEQHQQPGISNKDEDNIKETNKTCNKIQRDSRTITTNNKNTVNEHNDSSNKKTYENKSEESENNFSKQTVKATTAITTTAASNFNNRKQFNIFATDKDKIIVTSVHTDNNKNLNNTGDNTISVVQTCKSPTAVVSTTTCCGVSIMTPFDGEKWKEVSHYDNNHQLNSDSLILKTTNINIEKSTSSDILSRKKPEALKINEIKDESSKKTSVSTSPTDALLLTTKPNSLLPTLPSDIISPNAYIHLQHISSEPLFGVELHNEKSEGSRDKDGEVSDSKFSVRGWLPDTSVPIISSVIKPGTISASSSKSMVRKTSDSVVLLPRRVSFPKSDHELVTGYLEPANPWEHAYMVNSISEIAELYIASCHKHNTKPLQSILDHLKAVNLTKQIRRQPLLSLKSVKLAPSDCEALEEVLKRLQYKSIDLSDCKLDETAASALFDMIEYYEAANELDISANAMGMTHRGWTSCIYMISHSQELQVLNAEGNPISKLCADQLGNALSTSNLHTLKLEHCGLKGAPLSGLCYKIWQNKILKELWLAYNDLDCNDADTIAQMLKNNHYLELIDISNNNIRDEGLRHIVKALIMQSKELERRTTFQRTAAIEDDDDEVMSSTESTPPVNLEDNNKTSLDWSTKCEDNESIRTKYTSKNSDPHLLSDSNITKDSLPLIEEIEKCVEAEVRTNQHKVKPPLISSVGSTIDETDGDEDTDDTVRSSTIKNPLQFTSSGQQSMLDKLLSMNSESSSEDGASNLSIDTLAACNSEDASLISDEIFDNSAKTTVISSTNTNAAANTIIEVTSLNKAKVTETSSVINPTTAFTLYKGHINEGRVTKPLQSSLQKCDLIDHNIKSDEIVNVNLINPHSELENSLDIQSSLVINYNINNNSNNNSTTSSAQTDSLQTFSNIAESQTIPGSGVFEVKAEERDCLLSSNTTHVGISDDHDMCSREQSNVLQHHTASRALDVNKNTKLAEDFDDTHSTDSAFESASEGDISRHLPEEFTRLSASLESRQIDEIAKELAIETATIASESNECLIAAVSQITPSSTPTSATPPSANLSTPLTEKDRLPNESPINSCFSSSFPTVTYTSPPTVQVNFTTLEDSNGLSIIAADEVRDKIPKVTIAQDSFTQKYKLNSAINSGPSQIPTPPPPSTSPGGASSGLRRTETSCGFLNQSSRNKSQSSDSLCSDNSLDGSIGSGDLNFYSPSQLNEKITKNDTLTRQSRPIEAAPELSTKIPGGLKALSIWNNNLTKESGPYISDLLAETVSLELLNIGKNCLSNEFISSIKDSLIKNTSLTTLGLQSAHLSAKGIEMLSSILTFGGNSTLQRIDIRDNKLEVESLTKIAEVLKSNTTVMQIDIDDEPKRLPVGSEEHLDYARILENVRSMCARNDKTQAQMQQEKSSANTITKKCGGYYLGSRKISLTCQSRPIVDVSKNVVVTTTNNKLDSKRKASTRLRSPAPSPTAISPSSSPNRASRFQVFRVTESSPLTPTNTQKPIGKNLAATKAVSMSSAAIHLSLANEKESNDSNYPCKTSVSLPTSCSLPTMATVSSSTQSIKRLSGSSRSRFLVEKVYEDPHLSLSTRYSQQITPPNNSPPAPISRNVKDLTKSVFLESTQPASISFYECTSNVDDVEQFFSSSETSPTPLTTIISPPIIITPLQEQQQEHIIGTTTDVGIKPITITPILTTSTSTSSATITKQCDQTTRTTTDNSTNQTKTTTTFTEQTRASLQMSKGSHNLQSLPPIPSTMSALSSSSSESSSPSVSSLSSSSSTSPASNTDSTGSSSSPVLSACLNDVIHQQHSDLTSTAQCPIAVFNDNDITLTKNTVNKVFGTVASSNIADTSNENTITSSPFQQQSQHQQQHQQRLRKVSWISNPTAVDKLLILFHNPSTIFQRSSSPESKTNTTTVNSNLTQSPPTYAEATAAGVIVGAQPENSQKCLMPLRKSSPPSLTTLGNDIINVAASNNVDFATAVATTGAAVASEQSRSFFDVASKQFRDFSKQVFRQNISFSNESITTASTSITVMSAANVQNIDPISNENIARLVDCCKCGSVANASDCLCGGGILNTEYDANCIPTEVKQEIKENISPEHTINEETLHTMQKLYDTTPKSPLNLETKKDNVDWTNTKKPSDKNITESKTSVDMQSQSTIATATQITQSIVASKSDVESEFISHNT